MGGFSPAFLQRSVLSCLADIPPEPGLHVVWLVPAALLFSTEWVLLGDPTCMPPGVVGTRAGAL